ncbi:collagen alpha-1(I) chain-like isoform X2 [Corvus hawaiiensis]|uniref:collagen alpha-1(I) chain-like isoform X2 n=1 Tax=Corvus hawaiiensis TaxID=134902 RepID=UPI002019F86B|nr:collagen alpha-1(I) chain-like isoform X2 [Corvus hawaiiensis]
MRPLIGGDAQLRRRHAGGRGGAGAAAEPGGGAGPGPGPERGWGSGTGAGNGLAPRLPCAAARAAARRGTAAGTCRAGAYGGGGAERSRPGGGVSPPLKTSAAPQMQLRFDGRFGFPGGLAEPGEPLEAALERELREELGPAAAALRLRPRHHRGARAWPRGGAGSDGGLVTHLCRGWCGSPSGWGCRRSCRTDSPAMLGSSSWGPSRPSVSSPPQPGTPRGPPQSQGSPSPQHRRQVRRGMSQWSKITLKSALPPELIPWGVGVQGRSL